MRLLSGALLFAIAAFAAKPIPPAAAEDETVAIEAVAHIDKADVITALGQDPGMDLIAVQVKFAPRGENKVRVDLDDFTLISRKDGQRSQPLAPSQIAGSGALIVTPGSTGGGGGGMGNPRRGPIWGGVPGTGGRPRRVGGDQDNGSVSGPTGAQATVMDGKSDIPLQDVLKSKALQPTETSESVTGLLYFFLEGKHKLKHLELMYKSPAGRLMLDFEK